MIDRDSAALQLFAGLLAGRAAAGQNPDRFRLRLDALRAVQAADAFKEALADAASPQWAGAAAVLDAAYDAALTRLLDEARDKLEPHDEAELHRLVKKVAAA